MGKKIRFNVENVNIVDERNDSQFAILEIDAFASGKNRHNMYVSKETLEKTSKTILSKPITWVYDKFFDDVGSHDDMQVPGGFVPSDSPIRYTELEDGRTMMTVLALIWKRYSGNLLSFFKRDGGKKGVSVEMEVFDSVEMEDGLTELKDFCYSAITCLGDMVTPAIPWAEATVLKFSDEYKNDYNKEFSNKYSMIDFTIPDSVKSNSKHAMDLYRQYGGGNSVALSNASYFLNNSKIDLENIKNIYSYLERYSNLPLQDQTPENRKYLNFMLSGGSDAMDWLKGISDKIHEINSKSFFYKEEFVYKSLKDLNPALKGIDPPISLGQANQIARVAESIGSDKEKNGWAIAIGNFKKTHKVQDGKWVEKEKMSEFASEDWGKGEALKVNKSKEALSNSSWGSVDKTSLRNKILGASNYKSLVKDVYMLVESGWEDSPSSKLKYPVMELKGGTLVYNSGGLSSALGYAKKEGVNSVVSKVESIRSKMGIGDEDEGDNKKEKLSMAEKDEELKEEEKKDENFQEKSPDQDVEKKEEEKEKEENPEEEKKEEDAGKKFSLDEYIDVTAALAFLEGETEDNLEVARMACDEMKKGEFADPGKVVAGMYAMMMKYAEKAKEFKERFEKAEGESRAYMAENEELKKFKAEVEARQFQFEVESTMKEVENAVKMPKEEFESLVEKSKEFSLDTLDAWKNLVKAQAFSYAKKDTKEETVVKYALPFGEKSKPKDFLWE